MRVFKEIDWASDMPACQHGVIVRSAPECGEPGIYDTPTKWGTAWANLCIEHLAQHTNENEYRGFVRRAP